MIYLVTFVLLVWIWIIAEWLNAPTINDDTKQDDDDSTVEPNDTIIRVSDKMVKVYVFFGYRL